MIQLHAAHLKTQGVRQFCEYSLLRLLIRLPRPHLREDEVGASCSGDEPG